MASDTGFALSRQSIAARSTLCMVSCIMLFLTKPIGKLKQAGNASKKLDALHHLVVQVQMEVLLPG